MTRKTNREFADYLDMVGNDYAESGREATAEDYHEAADRIRRLLVQLASQRAEQDSPSARYAPTHGGYPG